MVQYVPVSSNEVGRQHEETVFRRVFEARHQWSMVMTLTAKQRTIDPFPVIVLLLLGLIVAVAIIADITHKSVNSHVPGQVETDLEHSQNPAPVQQRAEAQQSAAQSVQTPQQIEQERFAKKRELIAANLRETLNDAGYDITVGEVPVGKLGPTLILHGDIYKDTTIRMESLQMLRSIANDRLCPWGFRQVNIGSGLFSNSDYSLHCPGIREESSKH
jgi:hypothetical protein